MTRVTRPVILAVLAIGTAHAAPLREQLTKDEIKAAADAAAAALPKVNRAAAERCQAEQTRLASPGKPDELAAIARCYRAAGSLGAAILVWRDLVLRHPAAVESLEATRALGPAHEAAGQFADAAQWNATYARKYGRERDALERMTRAVCTWRQLGMADNAERDFKYLRGASGAKQQLDPATLCDRVRPIAVPPKP